MNAFYLSECYRAKGIAPLCDARCVRSDEGQFEAGRVYHQEATDKALVQAFLCQASSCEEQTVLLTFHSPTSQAQSWEK